MDCEVNPQLAGYFLPAQETNLLRGRVLIITGVGRSGTTIMGKILGSMHPAEYLFEPIVVRYLAFMCKINPGQAEALAGMTRSLLTEDYLLARAQGRNLNFNPREDSYVGNYTPMEEVRKKWDSLSQRREVVEYFRQHQPLWVIKIPEFQRLSETARLIFPGVRFLEVVRNGNEAVSSALRRGWYTDQFMNKAILDWVQPSREQKGCNLPWYIDELSKAHFGQWNQATRAACVWRCLTQAGLDFHRANPQEYLQIRYEKLIADPVETAKGLAKSFGLVLTDLTRGHLAAVREHRHSEHPSVVDQIQLPERDKFVTLMDELGYPVD